MALGAGALKLLAEDSTFDPFSPITQFSRIPTYCEVCFWKCAGWTYTDDKGKIVKVIGNDEDPHCNGRLCPRGTGGIGMYYDEDRLLTPLVRVSENGKQTFRPASWEEALGIVAENLKKIADKYGPESLALFKHGSSGHYFEQLVKAYGSGNIVSPSYAQCRGPREVGWKATFGTTVGSPEPTDIRRLTRHGRIVAPQPLTRANRSASLRCGRAA